MGEINEAIQDLQRLLADNALFGQTLGGGDVWMVGWRWQNRFGSVYRRSISEKSSVDAIERRDKMETLDSLVLPGIAVTIVAVVVWVFATWFRNGERAIDFRDKEDKD